MEFAKIKGITAMTDVTGFGLLGHLSEMCEGSNLSAIIEYEKIPRFADVEEYIVQNCIPGGTHRNWDSYGQQIQLKEESSKALLCDPQTSGGLLIAVEKTAINEVEGLLRKNNYETQPIGYMTARTDVLIKVV
jgi:selenide,water dikinase